MLEDGQLFYAASLQRGDSGIQLVDRSPLGLVRSNGDFSQGLRVTGTDTRLVDIEYQMISGKQLQNKTTAREFSLSLENQALTSFKVDFWLFEDGIAFRYVFPEESDSLLQVTSEITGFAIPPGSSALLQPYDSVTKYTPAYERYFLETRSGAPSPTAGGWCFPALFRVNNAWVLITESGLTNSYFGAHLYNADSGGMYTIQQPDSAEAFGNGSVNASIVPPWTSPWRVLIIGEDISTIVESNLVNHVAKKRVDRDFSWVTPGRASWSWWSDQASPRNFGTLKKFVDMAADMRWEYSLVDANWNEMEGGNLQELAAYAGEKGVGLWAWYNSGGPHNEVTEQPRDIMSDPLRRREEMARLKSWGIKGIKVDFFQSDKQFIIDQYLGILQDAADNQLMVNFHGCTVPRGWTRTWPNLLTMESVRGGESYIFAREFPGEAPSHNVRLVFTRNVTGPMDYTPVTFSDNTYAHQTTYAHELALSVVFESGIQHFADAITAYGNLDGGVKEFMREVPVVWDETRFISGSPNSHAVLARRHNADWFIAGINGERKAIQTEIDYSFLGQGSYRASVFTDGSMARTFSVATDSITTLDKRTYEMRSAGGFVVWLKAENDLQSSAQ